MFGKILVFVHLGLSLTFATWAMTIYLSRGDDWKVTAKDPVDGVSQDEIRRLAGGKTDENYNATLKAYKLPGRMVEYDTSLRGGVRPAEGRLRDARARLEKEEKGRPAEKEWYEKQLTILREGKFKEKEYPIKQIDRDKDGQPIVIVNPPPGGDLLQMGPIKDEKGQPMKGPDGNPVVLQSLDFYSQEYGNLIAQENRELLRRKTAAARDIEATKKLTGPRGLQNLIRFEAEKLERVQDEYNEVRPLWLNTVVELQNLTNLQTRLQDRLKQLESLKSKGDREGR